MLSAALLGAPSTPSTNSHPPTPPRTPKMAAALAAASAELKPPPLAHSQAGQVPGQPPMPPLLSLAAIQEQVNKGPNILAAQLSKPMMGLPGLGGPGGLNPGGPGNSWGHSQIPPHILAAQRAGVLPGKFSKLV